MPEPKTIKIPKFIGRLMGYEEVTPPGGADAPADAGDGQDAAPTNGGSRHEAPSLPGTRPVSGTTGNAVTTDETAVRQYADQLMTSALAAAPDKFKGFLEQRDASLEVLKGSLSGDVLVEKAIALAAKATKLGPNDVKAAFVAAQTVVKTKRSEFATDLGAERAERVDRPATRIANTQKDLADIALQMRDLEQRTAALEASIAPEQQAIADAERQLAAGQEAFEMATAFVDENLKAMEAQLLTYIKKGGK